MVIPDKKKNFYRPKINKKNFNTIHRYSRFINQCVDPTDWGFQKHHRWNWAEIEDFFEEGSTSHTLKNTYDYTLTFVKGKYFGEGNKKRRINTIDDIFLIDRDSTQFPEQLETWNKTGKLSFQCQRHLCLEHHLFAAKHKDKANLLFYTSSPCKLYNLICLDIDDIESDDAYHAVVDYLYTLFPNCYCERSTNRSGLHYYILVDYNSDRLFYSPVNEGVYRNVLSCLLSEALQPVINDHFDVKFDAVKGTCPLYDMNDMFLKYGTLVKLPAPVTYDQFHALYNCRVFSEYQILQRINYLYNFTCNYPLELYQVDTILSSLTFLLKDIPIRSTPKDFISRIDELLDKNSQQNTSPINTPFLSYTITNGGTNSLQGKKEVNNNKYTLLDIMNEGDSRIRESLYIKKYVGEYYSQYRVIPNEDMVESAYRADMNYHKIGEFRKKRFHKYYQHTVDTFDINKASDGSAAYKIGMYDEVIQHTDTELTCWCKNNTAYKRNIYRYDVDIALEYIYICSKNRMNKARELLIKKYAEREKITEEQAAKQLEDTTPRNGLIEFSKHVAQKHKTAGVGDKIKKINACDNKKATALFEYMTHHDLVVCTDDSFERCRARKFRLSERVSQVRERWNHNQADPSKTAVA